MVQTGMICLKRPRKCFILFPKQPYCPDYEVYPRNADGEQLLCLFELRFEDMPFVPFMPRHGILQVFLDGIADFSETEPLVLTTDDKRFVVRYFEPLSFPLTFYPLSDKPTTDEYNYDSRPEEFDYYFDFAEAPEEQRNRAGNTIPTYMYRDIMIGAPLQLNQSSVIAEMEKYPKDYNTDFVCINYTELDSLDWMFYYHFVMRVDDILHCDFSKMLFVRESMEKIMEEDENS